MNDIMSILHPVREVKLQTRTAIVRELPWKQQREFSSRLTTQIDALLKARPGTAAPAGVLSIETLVAGIKDSMELSEWLVANSSDLKPADIDVLSTTEFFTVLDAALDLNFTAYVSGAKKAFGRIGNFVGGNAAATTTQPTQSPQP